MVGASHNDGRNGGGPHGPGEQRAITWFGRRLVLALEALTSPRSLEALGENKEDMIKSFDTGLLPL